MGAGLRGGPTGSSSKNSAWAGAGLGTALPTPRRSRTVSAYRAPAGPME